ncbi:hypothetical protein HYH02_014718 [Chlamydomonas schloesseri]|uniref:Fibronectin type-III domain-containing protein n=1 Tax=Chlamydomonas schloesseri TaxID=2026947 RepID=A0A835VT49_9CHLO|nr:hypothetical protein HYH02_014718 [Chlamydomonas schloesseri]|eukprot:KAG2426865.1 hypothetical protein HYH02_014718 [Chlamydomonas schloesseri]
MTRGHCAAHTVRLRLAAARSLLGALASLSAIALVLHTLPVLGQDLVLVGGSAGCIDKVPGPPAKLKATAKDGKVLLAWDPPADGACVSQYIVNVMDAALPASLQSTSTSARSAVVEGLLNGRTYSFSAYASKYLGGGTAKVLATPSDRCDPSVAPGNPTNLRVQGLDTAARVCWDGVSNDACVDEWRLSAVLVSGPAFRSANDGSSGAQQKISRGACANVTGLVNDAKYKFSVLGYSKQHGEGAAGAVTAQVGALSAASNGWVCNSMDGCHPDRPGLCLSGGGCDAVKRMGQCYAPAMQDVDWVQKQVTQWCSSTCDCKLTAAQGGSLMGGSSGWASALSALGSMAGSRSFGALTGGGNGGGDSGGGGTAGAAAGAGNGALLAALTSVGTGASGSAPQLGGLGAFLGAGGAGTASAVGPGGGGGNSVTGGMPFGPELSNILGGSLFSGGTAGGGGSGGGGGAIFSPASSIFGAGSTSGGGLPAGGTLLSDLQDTRAGQMVTNVANGLVQSGVVGDAVGKMTSQYVNNMLQSRLGLTGGSGSAAGQ